MRPYRSASLSDTAPLDLAPEDAEPPALPPSKARLALLKRLADVLCLPSSRVNAFERSMTADLLVEILRDASVEERGRVAMRLSNLLDPPSVLARLLLRCDRGLSPARRPVHRAQRR